MHFVSYFVADKLDDELAVEKEFDCDMVSNVDQEFDVGIVRNRSSIGKANRGIMKAKGLCFIGQGRRGISAEAVVIINLLIRAKEML